MNVGKGIGFLVSLVIVAALGFALLLTGIWYTAIAAGLAASLLIRKGYLVSVLSSFAGGMISVAFMLLTLPVGYVGAVMNEVAAIAGISATVLFALMFLVSGALALSGALFGTFIASIAINPRSGGAVSD